MWSSAIFFKGIVSRDWGELQIVLLDRYAVYSFLNHIYFLSKSHFHIKFFKNVFRPGTL
jgi:hypothetical protein